MMPAPLGPPQMGGSGLSGLALADDADGWPGPWGAGREPRRASGCFTSPTRSPIKSSRSSPRDRASATPIARAPTCSRAPTRRFAPSPCSSARTAASTWSIGTTRSSRTTRCRGTIPTATASAAGSGGSGMPRSRCGSPWPWRNCRRTTCRSISAPRTRGSPTSPGRRSSIAGRRPWCPVLEGQAADANASVATRAGSLWALEGLAAAAPAPREARRRSEPRPQA